MSQIGLKRYRLLFYGNVMEEADPQQARQRLAARYKLSDAQLAACFSGRKVALHKDLDEATAYRIQSELEDSGLITHLELTHEERAAPKQAYDAKPLEAPAPTPESSPEATTSRAQAEQMAEALLAAAVASRPARTTNWGLWAMLMLAVALAGVMIWLGMPMYQSTQLQKTILAGLAQGEAVEAELAEFVERTGFWPNSNLDAGLGSAESYGTDVVSGVRIGQKSLIVVTFRKELDQIGGTTLVLVPQQHEDGSISWRCDGGTLDKALMPANCRPPDATAYQFEPDADPLALSDLKGLAGAPGGPAHGPAPNYVKRVIMEEIGNTRDVRKQVVQMKMLDVAWPENNQQAGLPEGRTLGSQAFRRIEVQPNGRIMYEFSSAIQGFEGHKLFLVPGEIGKWRCEGTFPPEYMPDNCAATL